MVRFAREAAARNAELIVFPELSITGYPPRDLVEKPDFIERSERAVEQLADATKDLPLSISRRLRGAFAQADRQAGHQFGGGDPRRQGRDAADQNPAAHLRRFR